MNKIKSDWLINDIIDTNNILNKTPNNAESETKFLTQASFFSIIKNIINLIKGGIK
jgi:hypothetical protein